MKLRIEVHHYHHAADTELLSAMRRIEQRIIEMSTDLTRITTEVSEMSTVVDSAVALLGDLSQRIRENATDPAALNALADTLDNKANALAAAVAANTPAAGEVEHDLPGTGSTTEASAETSNNADFGNADLGSPNAADAGSSSGSGFDQNP